MNDFVRKKKIQSKTKVENTVQTIILNLTMEKQNKTVCIHVLSFIVKDVIGNGRQCHSVSTLTLVQ